MTEALLDRRGVAPMPGSEPALGDTYDLTRRRPPMGLLHNSAAEKADIGGSNSA